MAASVSSPVNLLFGAGLLLAALPHVPVERPAPVTPQAAMSEPSLSPDRREIAFVSGGDIWTVPATGGEARLLVSHPATDSRPLYSPDGTRLAFMSTRTGNGDIYVLTLATGQLERVTYDDVSDQLDAWSRDGKWHLLLVRQPRRRTGMNDVFRVSADGRHADGGERRSLHAGVLVRAVAGRTQHDRIHGDGASRPATGGGTATATRRERDLAGAPRAAQSPRYEAVTKDDARDAWPMWSGDGKALVLRVGQERAARTSGRIPRAGGEGAAVTSFTDGPRALADDRRYDGKTIVFERDFGVWTLDVAIGQGGTRCRSRFAARADGAGGRSIRR